jgi:UDP-N-acetylmuramoyl-tripeptide--D-alanyl-D-alanine ligase
MRLQLAEVAQITAGRIVFPEPDLIHPIPGDPVKASGEPASPEAIGVKVDSRTVIPGEIFVAINGEHLDGHDYVAHAFSRGAVAAIVQQELPAPGPQIVVADTLAALAALGAWARDVTDPLVIGITGSVGKTTTKDLLFAIARRKFSTVAAERSFNTEVGVPLTLLRATDKTEVVICELGARGDGQIEELCKYARPQMGVVTNVDITHYEQFGSKEAVAQAKGELVESLPEGGAAVLNADDPLVLEMAGRTKAEVLTFGFSGPPDLRRYQKGIGGSGLHLRGEQVRVDHRGRATFRMAVHSGPIPGDPLWGSGDRSSLAAWVMLGMSGRHQVQNALAAAAAGLAIGLPLDECRAGLEAAVASPWRMQVDVVDEVVIVNDAYNANPTSTIAALETCVAMVPEGGRLIAILGYMAELGAIESEEHLRVGKVAASYAKRLIVVGPNAAGIAEGAREQGLVDVRVVSTREAAMDELEDLQPKDLVLVKASRIIGLEKLAEEIKHKVAKR